MAAIATMAQTMQATSTELIGTHLGTIERRYGLLSATIGLRIAVELGRTADLAAADRIAYVNAVRTGTVTLVIESNGWYSAVVCDEAVTAEQMLMANIDPAAPRLMSVVSHRGISPVLGPLAAQHV